MVGEKLGEYKLLQSIGTGSTGTVYRALRQSDGRSFAVKLVRSRILYDTRKRERFLQGLLTVSEIRHPGICPIIEIGDENDDFFVVTPLLKGMTLNEHLASGTHSWQEKIDIALEVGEALAAGHDAGAVHRGLKPANVWIEDGRKILLTDFALARFTEIEKDGAPPASKPKSDFADTLIPMKALAYMSPEQVRGAAVDHRSDIFSFGALLYEMLTGIHPFESRNSLSRMHAILEGAPPGISLRGTPLPSELDPILDKALAKLPERRYQSMREFLRELRQVREASRPSETRTEDTAAASAHRTRSLRRPLALGILLAVLALIIYWLRQ